MTRRKVKRMRRRKLVSSGQDRKSKLRNQGTTPVFPIHKEEHTEKSAKK